MAYLKYKEVTKYFNFSKVINKDKLPKYVNDYVFSDDQILAAFKTSRDHGIFTTKYIILYDYISMFGIKKRVYTIPYKSISTINISFMGNSVEYNLYLDSGYPLKLKFINTHDLDKTRLRLLYSCICRAINGLELTDKQIKQLEI